MHATRLWQLTLVFTVMFTLAGCGKKTESAKEASKTAEADGGTSPDKKPTTSAVVGLPVAKNPMKTSYISDDFGGALAVHPRQIMQSKPAQELLKKLEAQFGKPLVDGMFAQQKAMTGADIRDVEEIVVLIDETITGEMLRGMRPRRIRGDIKTQAKSYAPERNREYRKTEAFDPGEKVPPRSFRKTKDARKFDPERKTESNERKDEPGRKKEANAFDEDLTEIAFQPGEGLGRKEDPDFDRDMREQSDPIPSLIVRFANKYNRDDVLAALTKFATQMGGGPRFGRKEPPKPTKLPEVKLGDHTGYRVGPFVVCFADDTTIIGGPQKRVEKMLKAKNVESPLTKRLAALENDNDVVIAGAGDDFALKIHELVKLAKSDIHDAPKNYRTLPDLVAGMQSFAMTIKLSGDPVITLAFQMRDASAAGGVADIVNKHGLPDIKAEYAKEKKRAPDSIDPEFANAIEDLMDSVQVGTHGSDLVFNLKRSKSVEDLPKLVLSAVNQAREAARRSQRKNNLKQIGLAMHNYYETFSRFPTHGSNGEPKGQGRKEGLSWRVHLLPFLEQGNLYRQFHLDEPWDSAHNKTLIANMPEVFANPSDKESTMSGKTSIHVFVGPKTPFGGENGSRFRDMTDGTSNTLMAVQAGPDKADIWTKPGGLMFDPKKNPVELLGNVGKEFLALFCDGYATAIRSTIKPETLKLLIQHNDHQRIIPDPAVERFRRFDGPSKSFKSSSESPSRSRGVKR